MASLIPHVALFVQSSPSPVVLPRTDRAPQIGPEYDDVLRWERPPVLEIQGKQVFLTTLDPHLRRSQELFLAVQVCREVRDCIEFAQENSE